MGYCLLPVFLFLLLWLRPVAGIPLAVLLALALVPKAQTPVFMHSPFERLVLGLRTRVQRPTSHTTEENDRTIPLSLIVLVALVALLWCVLGGQGGIWFQNGDWDGRNAVFRDLITHDWPVVYEYDGAALCYYVAHWLPSALVAKLLVLVLGGEAAWMPSNLVLLIWTATGVTLLFLLVIDLLDLRSRKMALLGMLVLMLFSTPDAAGMVLAGTTSRAHTHIEWWALNAQFSSITTCLFYVFNQVVIPWICTLLFLRERTPARYLLLWVACLLAGPLPAIGLAALMLGEGLSQLIASQERPALLRSVVSRPNLLALPSVLAIGLFYLSTTAYEPTEEWVRQNLLPFPLYFPSLGN